MPEFVHTPVLMSGVIQLMDLRPTMTVVDATLGLGGHAESMLECMNGEGRLVGIDQDKDALSRATARLEKYGDKFVPVFGNFRDIRDLVHGTGAGQVDRILFDLGVSSLQLDDGLRGFSFKADAPLDMRMDVTAEVTAADILRTYTEQELVDLLTEYGEEPRAKLIARRVVESRVKHPIETTGQLVALIGGSRGKIHPATRTFQALRMAVNDELGAVEQALPQSLDLLASGGRMAVITFHSLEDRLVKQTFKRWEEAGEIKLINKKVVQATWEEKQKNPRSRSAKLRVIEKI